MMAKGAIRMATSVACCCVDRPLLRYEHATEDRAVNEGLRCSPLPAVCPARLPARRLLRNGDFVDEDLTYLAKTFSTMDLVLLADWVAGGMQADRDTLVRRCGRWWSGRCACRR